MTTPPAAAAEVLRELLAALRACAEDSHSNVEDVLRDLDFAVHPNQLWPKAEQRLHAALVAAEAVVEPRQPRAAERSE